MKQFALFAAGIGATLAIASSAHAAGTDPYGVWLNDTGRGAIEIKPCGNNVCGFVVAVKDANDTKGCGKQIIGDAAPVGSGRWDNGWIYSPEKKKNYDVELKPLADGTLRVVGYAGTKLFSRTMIWTPAPSDMKRCDVTEAAAKPATPETSPTPKAAEAAPATAPTPAPVTAPVKSAEKPAAAPADATVAKSEPAKPADAKTTAPAADAPKTDTAEADDGGEKPGERSGGKGLKIGDLDLDKVLTRTASGKCKLDLPWVKVKFDCAKD